MFRGDCSPKTYAYLKLYICIYINHESDGDGSRKVFCTDCLGQVCDSICCAFFFWQRNQVNLKQVSTMTFLAALPLWIHAAYVHKGCGGTNIPCGGTNIPCPHCSVPKFSPHCQICLFFATGGPAAGSAWAEEASWKSSCFGLHAV